MFLSPMFPKSKEQYKATETQAIGRARRYGQTKTVTVWRFIAKDTIDVELYQQFAGVNYQVQAEQGIAPPPVPPNVSRQASPAHVSVHVAASPGTSNNTDMEDDGGVGPSHVASLIDVDQASEALETDAEMELDLRSIDTEEPDPLVDDTIEHAPGDLIELAPKYADAKTADDTDSSVSASEDVEMMLDQEAEPM
jgi:hypothetical protein